MEEPFTKKARAFSYVGFKSSNDRGHLRSHVYCYAGKGFEAKDELVPWPGSSASHSALSCLNNNNDTFDWGVMAEEKKVRSLARSIIWHRTCSDGLVLACEDMLCLVLRVFNDASNNQKFFLHQDWIDLLLVGFQDPEPTLATRQAPQNEDDLPQP